MDINENSNIVYKDYPLYKKLNKNGELYICKDSEALTQALQIWLSSEKGEKLRNTSGGIIIPYLGKTIDDSTAKDIENAIRDGLKNEFRPSIEVVYLKVDGDKKNNRWIIHLAGFNSDLAIGVNTNVIVMNI